MTKKWGKLTKNEMMHEGVLRLISFALYDHVASHKRGSRTKSEVRN